MLDLFDAPVVPGPATQPDINTRAAEAELIARIDDIGLSPFKFQRWTGKRLTRSFGWSYVSKAALGADRSDARVAVTCPRARPPHSPGSRPTISSRRC